MTEVLDTFTHDGVIYDLSSVRRLIRDHKSFLLPIEDLLWIHSYDTPREDRIAKARLRYPLLVSKDKLGRWTVVDGLHRLEKYRRLGIKVIPVKEVTLEILNKALITKK